MALFNAYVLLNSAGDLAHRVVFLVRKQPVTSHKEALQSVDTMKDLQSHIAEKYSQKLQPFDLEVVDAADMKARIKKLNKKR